MFYFKMFAKGIDLCNFRLYYLFPAHKKSVGTKNIKLQSNIFLYCINSDNFVENKHILCQFYKITVQKEKCWLDSW